jgi:hypothetical protein
MGRPGRTGRVRRLLFGGHANISGTVYGTIIAMATVAAAADTGVDTLRLAALVLATAVVLWVAHVYSDTLHESIDRGHRLDRRELVQVGRRELAIVLAAAGPCGVLILGAAGLISDSRAVSLALWIGLAALAAQGVRYARAERLGTLGTLTAVGVNAALGIAIVALEVALSH